MFLSKYKLEPVSEEESSQEEAGKLIVVGKQLFPKNNVLKSGTASSGHNGQSYVLCSQSDFAEYCKYH